MAQDPEHQSPQEEPPPAPKLSTSLLPFDIREFLPEKQRTRLRFRRSRPNLAVYSSDTLFERSNFRTARRRLGAAVWYMLLITMLLLLLMVFVIDRFGEWSSQAAYPGSEACYRAEQWLYGVNSDVTRIQWALADAEEEVANLAEAEEANNRIWQMYADMRISLVDNPAPEGLAKLRGLWIKFLDLSFEIREADLQDDAQRLRRLREERNEVVTQRQEEEGRIVHICGLADSNPITERAIRVWDREYRQIAMGSMSLRSLAEARRVSSCPHSPSTVSVAQGIQSHVL